MKAHLYLQDVGRAFGYGERPILVLSQNANDFLDTIWDSDAGSVSWENLRRYKPAVLGKQMIRRPASAQSNNAVDDDDELELFKDIFEKDPKDPVMLYDLGPESFQHRLILKAEPQIGKTGAFLFLIYLLHKKLRSHHDQFWIPRLEESTAKVYREKTTFRMAEEFQTDEGKAFYQAYQSDLSYARKKREREDIVEPARWAAVVIAEALEDDDDLESVRIADFGCGDEQFAKAFNEEYSKRTELQGIRVEIDSFDLSPEPIPDVETHRNITINSFPGTNCSEERNFEKERYDFVVSTLALWGARNSWKETIKSALMAMGRKGRFLLAEFQNKFPAENCQTLGQAGVDVSYPTSDLDRTQFSKKLIGVSLTKGKKFNPAKVLECLSRFEED